MSKWTRPGNEGKRVSIATGPIRLFPHLKMGHPGWGVEDEEVTALKLFHALGCPEICKVDYSWKAVPTQPTQQQHLGSDLSAAELEQYYQLFNNAEGNVAIKNEGSNHSGENSYSPEGHYFTLDDFHHSDEDHFDDLNIKLSSNDAFGFESGESHSYSVEERQVILPDISMNTLNNLLNSGGEHESKNSLNTSQSGLNLSPVSINNASINNVTVQQQERENANQRSMLNASFSILHDASSMGFDASNDMFGTGFKHATSSFSTAVNNLKVEKIQSDQSPPPFLGTNNGANGQGYPSRPSPVTNAKRRYVGNITTNFLSSKRIKNPNLDASCLTSSDRRRKCLWAFFVSTASSDPNTKSL